MSRSDIADRRLALAAITLLLTACGGGSSGTQSSPATPPPASIQGVVIPSSVSVVTATNAQ
jgi:uncharacterized lipoprotein YajG